MRVKTKEIIKKCKDLARERLTAGHPAGYIPNETQLNLFASSILEGWLNGDFSFGWEEENE